MDIRKEIAIVLLGRQKEKVHYYLGVMRRCEKKNKDAFFIDGRFKFFGRWLVPFGDVRSSFMVNLYQVCKAFVEKYEHAFETEMNRGILISDEMKCVYSDRQKMAYTQKICKESGYDGPINLGVRNHSIKNNLKAHFSKRQATNH